MKFKNISYSKRTYYGITFNPGEVKDVPGYINDNHFVRVDEGLIDEIATSQPVDNDSKSSKTAAVNKPKTTTKGGTK